jgi:hypothetical protein
LKIEGVERCLACSFDFHAMAELVGCRVARLRHGHFRVLRIRPVHRLGVVSQHLLSESDVGNALTQSPKNTVFHFDFSATDLSMLDSLDRGILNHRADGFKCIAFEPIVDVDEGLAVRTASFAL